MAVEHVITGAGETVIEARFNVNKIELNAFRGGHHDDGGKWVNDPVKLAGTVYMNAVKHGTFGDATPNGNLSMMIANSHAFDVFKNAFEEAARAGKYACVFKVYFVLDENQT